jgi:hypothetical protein
MEITVQSFLQYLLSPIAIVLIGKYLDYKIERHQKKREEERATRNAKEQEMAATIELMKMGLLSMLRDRILQSCRYFIDQGKIDPLVLENITKMHDSYKALGGNGLCDRLYSKVQDLPLEE